jgi:hypothetical protein
MNVYLLNSESIIKDESTFQPTFQKPIIMQMEKTKQISIISINQYISKY